jgi:hypothetical protein
MKKKTLDLRIKDDPNIWAKAPRKPDDAFDYYYQKLIEENEKLMALADKKGCGPFDEPVRKKANPAQAVLLLVYRLDSQILNGGITQFCWNAPFEANDVAKAIKKLEQPELAKLYRQCDARLEEKLDEWEDLWVKGHDEGGKVGIECFHKTYALLDLGWFDKAYLKAHRASLVKALLQFVVKNKKRFVK